jgi:hypothetical protein
MPKQSAPLRPGDLPRPQPPGPDGAPVKGPPERPDVVPVRDSVQPAARQKRPGRRWDRYDYIGAAIVAFLVALWAVHFSLPTLPPDNVPDASPPIGRN